MMNQEILPGSIIGFIWRSMERICILIIELTCNGQYKALKRSNKCKIRLSDKQSVFTQFIYIILLQKFIYS